MFTLQFYWFSPHFFKEIRISALALLKMVTHARSGGHLEVMGLLLGKVDANTMVVMDAFALPVEGTETRVNAQSQAYEYMTAYIESAKQVLLHHDGISKGTRLQSLFLFKPGQSSGKCYWMVSFSSWLWLLALWN